MKQTILPIFDSSPQLLRLVHKYLLKLDISCWLAVNILVSFKELHNS